MSDKRRKIYLLAGVTAVGKSNLAVEWSEANDAEIISCDSVAIYRGMDIGTAKPDAELRNRIPHHGIDLFEVNDSCDVSQYQKYAQMRVDEILGREKSVLVVGGSGFYLQSFFAPVVDQVVVPRRVREEVETNYQKEGLNQLIRRLEEFNPQGLSGLDQLNPRRVMRALERCIASGKSILQLREEFESQPMPFENFSKQVLWLDRENLDLEARISNRTQRMLEGGLVEETRKLINSGIMENRPASNSIGYRETIACLNGEIDQNHLLACINTATRRLVSKQRKWFRKHLPANSRNLLQRHKKIQLNDLTWHRWS